MQCGGGRSLFTHILRCSINFAARASWHCAHGKQNHPERQSQHVKLPRLPTELLQYAVRWQRGWGESERQWEGGVRDRSRRGRARAHTRARASERNQGAPNATPLDANHYEEDHCGEETVGAPDVILRGAVVAKPRFLVHDLDYGEIRRRLRMRLRVILVSINTVDNARATCER